MVAAVNFRLLGIALLSGRLAAADAAPPVQADNGVPSADIRRFAQVFQSVRDNYVEALTDQQIMQAGLRGLLLDIDPHSSYLDARQARDFDDLSEGGYAGIGIESDERDPTRIRVVAPFDGTPAQRAGLRAGDFITAINGVAVGNDDAHAESMRLRGRPGSKVVLTVERAGVAAPFELEVIREVIALQSVKARWLQPGFAYFRISAFQGDTGLEFRRQWQGLLDQAPGNPAKGVLIDLRSNPGGLVSAAVEVADEFLSDVPVVSTRGRNALSDVRYFAKPGQHFDGVPVVVLVDAGSASASEILAGALQDNRRATIVGSRSFGKGSVQSIFRLDNGDAFKLTTGLYYTPNGRSIQAEGIVPDVLFSGGERTRVTEQGLRRHLGSAAGTDTNAPVGVVLEGDAYLEQALVVLKRSSAGAAPGLGPTR